MPLSLGIASGAGSLKDPTQPELLGYRVNYIPNPSFEVNSTGWSAFNSANISVTTDESFSGSSSLSILNTSQSGIELANRIPFLGGEGDYVLSAYVKLTEGIPEANYFIRYLQYEEELSETTVVTGNVGTQGLIFSGSWVRLVGVMPKSGIAGYFSIRVLTSSTTVGATYYVDAVMVEKGSSVGTYFDGSVAGGFWTGQAHNSYSGGTPF